jgi:hypothetical protein
VAITFAIIDHTGCARTSAPEAVNMNDANGVEALRALAFPVSLMWDGPDVDPDDFEDRAFNAWLVCDPEDKDRYARLLDLGRVARLAARPVCWT